MTDSSKEMLRQSIIPILLGHSPTAFALSLKIYKKCRIRSYLCCAGTGVLALLCPTLEHFPLYSKDDFDVQLHSLEYIADAQEFLPVLIPCNEYFRRAVQERREYLERRFILTTPEKIFDAKPFSDMIKQKP